MIPCTILSAPTWRALAQHKDKSAHASRPYTVSLIPIVRHNIMHKAAIPCYHIDMLLWHVTASPADAAPGVACLAVLCDITRPNQVAAMIETTKDKFGRLGYVFNSAGIAGSKAGAVHELPLEVCTPQYAVHTYISLPSSGITSSARKCHNIQTAPCGKLSRNEYVCFSCTDINYREMHHKR